MSAQIAIEFIKSNPEGVATRIRQLERENATLREDKERLEFCLRQGMWIFSTDPKERGAIIPILDRDDLDAAQKEAQP